MSTRNDLAGKIITFFDEARDMYLEHMDNVARVREFRTTDSPERVGAMFIMDGPSVEVRVFGQGCHATIKVPEEWGLSAEGVQESINKITHNHQD